MRWTQTSTLRYKFCRVIVTSCSFVSQQINIFRYYSRREHFQRIYFITSVTSCKCWGVLKLWILHTIIQQVNAYWYSCCGHFTGINFITSVWHPANVLEYWNSGYYTHWQYFSKSWLTIIILMTNFELILTYLLCSNYYSALKLGWYNVFQKVTYNMEILSSPCYLSSQEVNFNNSKYQKPRNLCVLSKAAIDALL